MNRLSIFSVLAAIADYLFKAAVNYRLTDEGAAEWSDVEAAVASLTGDEDQAEQERAQAVQQRANVRNRQTTRAVSQVNEVRRPLSED